MLLFFFWRWCLTLRADRWSPVGAELVEDGWRDGEGTWRSGGTIQLSFSTVHLSIYPFILRHLSFISPRSAFHSLNPALLYLSISYQSIFHPSHSVHSCAPPPFYKSPFYLSITVLICPYLPQSFLYFFIPPFPQYFDPAFLYPFISLSLQLYISPPFYLAINSISPSLQCFTPLSFALIYPSSLTALHYYVPPCSLTSFFPPSLQSSPTSTPLFPSPHLHLSVLSCFSSSLHPPHPWFPHTPLSVTTRSEILQLFLILL